MDIVIFDSSELPCALAALRGLPPSPSARQLDFLSVLARLHGGALTPDTLTPPAAAALIPDPHRRKRLVQLATVLSMVDGAVNEADARAVAELARTLEVHEPAVSTLQKLAAGHHVSARCDLLRRIFGRFMRDASRDHSLRDVLALTAPFFGGRRDRTVAARYERLAELPAGTLGRRLWEHCHDNGLSLPGQPGAIPERVLFHDLGHVLAGYGTDPVGELQQAAFQAGFVRRDGFAFLFFGVVQFHLGIKVTPVAEPATGCFESERVLSALARGAACGQDLSDHWDFWAAAGRPVRELQRELGIPALPLTAA